MAPEFVPLTDTPRPTLPARHANLRLAELQAKLPPVKFQEIMREGQCIIVGRLKIQTPVQPGHAFILRRYDTGAISLSTMFKAAFPTAPEEYERAEAAWIRANYDISGANGLVGLEGFPKLRLNGTWIKADLARHIAPAYGLETAIIPLIEAQPDGKAEYRRSLKSAPSSDSALPSVSVVAISVKEPDMASPPAKRRRAASPTDAKPQAVRTSPRKKTQSPAPHAAPVTQHDNSSDETAVAPDADEEPEVQGPDMHKDIQEQRELIADLKARRDASNAVPLQNNRKRRNEETTTPPPSFDFQKDSEIQERPIINPRRFQLQPHQKAAAWGTIAFAVGLGAVSLLPNMFL